MKSRILIVFAGTLCLWAAVLTRAGFLQLFPNDRIRGMKERQFQTVVTLQSRRGAIIDSKGRDLALSARAYSLYADPKILEDKKILSKKLAKVLGQTNESIYAKLKGVDRRFVWIARLLPKEKADEVKAWDERGLSVVEEFQRVYPNETLFAHSLGFVGAEGQGLEGLELAYDQALRGTKRKISMLRDARGRPLLANGMLFADNPDGAELKLTIDSEMQHMLEGELTNSVSEFEADQAFGVIMDVKTSAILAMANTPTFDANKASKVAPEFRRNRIVTDVFEPGSTMKTFAIAEALHTKILAPNKVYNTENGAMRVGDRIIREAETKDVWSHLTVSEILAYSSNVGATKIAFDLGADALRKGLMDFGFGAKTGIDLPGESKGMLAPLPWNQHLLSNISFGQGIGVTPLQVANAYAAIANGGVLNTPHLVQSIRDPETGELKEDVARPSRRVLTTEEASQMRMMLMGATAPGSTGTAANIEGFLVAGKTGTAQKANPTGRGYLSKAFLSSFAGFFPANDPRFVIYVAVDYPKRTSHFGGAVAAPVFARVASYAARMEGLAPTLLSEKNLIPTPAFKISELSHGHKKGKLASKKDTVGQAHMGGSLASLNRQMASDDAGLRLPMSAKVGVSPSPTMLSSADIVNMAAPTALGTVPNMHALSMREVLRQMSGKDVDVRFVGSGSVSETIPAAGAELGENKRLTVILK